MSLFNTLAAHGVAVTFVDATDAAAVERALTPATRLVFVETIANPRTQVADLAGIGALCRARGLVYVVDNTMTSPWLFRPKDVGASLVVNALTKYIGGHGNALAGSDHRHRALRLDALSEHRRHLQAARRRRCGASRRSARRGCATSAATLAAEQAHHIAVGAETLALRMDRTCANAQALAEFLAGASRGARGPLPGAGRRTRSTRGRSTLFRACGGSCRSSSSTASTASTCSTGSSIVVASSNLGDNRTLAIPVAHTIFWEMGPERRAEMGIADSLIRVSVGIEDTRT